MSSTRTAQRSKRRTPTALAAAVALSLLAVATLAAAPASADTRLATKTLSDASGGANGMAELWRRDSDGAVYPKVWVSDTKPDGICAHAAISWLHRNGQTYTDYGSHVCGNGTQAGPSVKGARNWREYTSVSLTVFVDRGTPATVLLAAFSTGTTPPPPPPPPPPPARKSPVLVQDRDGCQRLRQRQVHKDDYEGVRQGIVNVPPDAPRYPGVPYYPWKQTSLERFPVGSLTIKADTCRIKRGWGLIGDLDVDVLSHGLTSEREIKGQFKQTGRGWGLGLINSTGNRLRVRFMHCDKYWGWGAAAVAGVELLLSIPLPVVSFGVDLVRFALGKAVPKPKPSIRCADFGTYVLNLFVDAAGKLVVEKDNRTKTATEHRITGDAKEQIFWRITG